MSSQDTHSHAAAPAISSAALNITKLTNKRARQADSKQGRPVSCILNLFALQCPLLSLRTNEVPLDVIVLPLRLSR